MSEVLNHRRNCFTKHFSKRLQPIKEKRFTKEDIAGAVLTEAETLPNILLLVLTVTNLMLMLIRHGEKDNSIKSHKNHNLRLLELKGQLNLFEGSSLIKFLQQGTNIHNTK